MLKKSSLVLLIFSFLPISLYSIDIAPSDIDGRILFQGDSKRRDGDPYDERLVLRARFKTDIALDEDLNFTLGFGTGSSSTKTQKISLDESTVPFGIYNAYLDYTPTENVLLSVGKMSKPFWVSSRALFHVDYFNTGFAGQTIRPINDRAHFFINGGYFIMDSVTGGSDPSYGVFQPGVSYQFSEKETLKIGAAMYRFDNVKDKSLSFSSGSNSLEGGVLRYRYNPYVLSGELVIEDFKNYFEHLRLFGDYVNNTAVTQGNQAAIVGFEIGDQEIQKSDWRFMASFNYIQIDSWLDSLPDTAFMSGMTDAKGVMLEYRQGITDKLTLRYMVVFAERIADSTETESLYRISTLIKL